MNDVGWFTEISPNVFDYAKVLYMMGKVELFSVVGSFLRMGCRMIWSVNENIAQYGSLPNVCKFDSPSC